MALGIEGATLGYDKNNVQAAYNSLNAEVIEVAINAINGKLSDLRTAVDTVWVGASAEKFKSNMEYDADVVTFALNETREVLKTELYEIINKMDELDQNLVKGRE